MYEDTWFRLDGKVAAVIGAGSGIGRGGAIALAAHGARVICADRNSENAQCTSEAICSKGGVAEWRKIDVTVESSVRGFFTSLQSECGIPHVVVVTPGTNVRKPLVDYTSEEFDLVVNLNLKGTFFVMREAGRLMAKNGGGSIIAMASIRSQTVEPGASVYSATKGGVVLLVRTLAAELGPRGVRVIALSPGMVETPLTIQIQQTPDWYDACAKKTALRRWATPDDIAGAVVFLACDAARYVTGSQLFVDGGWTAIDGRFDPPV